MTTSSPTQGWCTSERGFAERIIGIERGFAERIIGIERGFAERIIGIERGLPSESPIPRHRSRVRWFADGLRLAVGTLTALPVPPHRVDRASARAAMLLAPIAVLPLGVAAALAGGLYPWLGLPPLVAAGLTIAVLALGSRGLHLDGLADTADGLGSGYDRNRALEIMRRGDTGPMGVAAVTLVLLIQVAGATAVLARPWGFVAVGVLICLSRTALYLACADGIPAARPDGLGATVASVLPRAAVVAGLLLAAVAGSAVLTVTGRPWWLGAAAVTAGTLAVAGVLGRCRRRFGGITGDVLGAVVEVDLLALLVVASVG